MPRFQHVLFDLDGTLIDSAPAILSSYRDAFEVTGLRPAFPIDASIIGPPLIETLEMLAGDCDKALIGELAEQFKRSYDSTGYRQTSAFNGINAMLARLKAGGLSISIATNKRLRPTLLILRHLGWENHFDAVYALDLFEPRLPNKAAMIARLLTDRNIEPAGAAYVGDRSEDGLSADANHLPFLAATWGYGSLSATEMAPHWRAFESPAALADALLATS